MDGAAAVDASTVSVLVALAWVMLGGVAVAVIAKTLSRRRRR